MPKLGVGHAPTSRDNEGRKGVLDTYFSTDDSNTRATRSVMRHNDETTTLVSKGTVANMS